MITSLTPKIIAINEYMVFLEQLTDMYLQQTVEAHQEPQSGAQLVSPTDQLQMSTAQSLRMSIASN